MKRSLAVLTVAATALAVSISIPASAGPRAHSAKLHKVTTFLELTNLHNADADQSGGNSPGDILTFEVTEYAKEGGKQIGAGHGYCVLNAEPFATCTSTVTDKDGTLVVVGDNNGGAKANVFAITGGTGAYARASGQTKAIIGTPTTRTISESGSPSRQ